MIANRSPQRRTRQRRKLLWLSGALTLVLAGGLGGGSAAATGDRHAAEGARAHAPAGSVHDLDAEDPAIAAPTGEKKAKKHAKHDAPPELPNLAYVIGNFADDTKWGKFLANHNNWWVVRPVFALLVVFIFLILMRGMYKKRGVLPTRFQSAMEMAVEALDNLISGILGKEVGRAYLPFLGGLFIYILSLNLFGLFPLAMSPTNFIATTAALALCTFLVVQYTAFSKLGVKGVVMHWLGEPSDAVTWVVGIVILLPLHIVEEFIKPLSLALRLFGNIFGEDVLLGSMLLLGIGILSFLPEAGIPVGLPLHLPFMFLATLTSTIQALVFALLSTIYIMMVLPHEDHDDDHHEEAHAAA